MITNYEAYAAEKKEFLKSLGDWACDSNGPNVYGAYRKDYYSTDPDNYGCWIEIMETVTEPVETEVEMHGCKVKIRQNVELIRTEFWNTKDPISKYIYQPR